MRVMWVTIIATVFVTATVFGTTIHVPHQYPTIQEGINASVSGDTVLVADGTYSGPNNRNLDYGGREIVVMSQNGADSTIIDCENSGRGVYFHTYEGRGAVLDGFTIINGSIDRGAGIYCDDVSPTILNCVIALNSVNTGSWNYGGGLYARNSYPLIENCIFYHNSTENGTWCHGGGMYLDDSSSVISNCIFQGNYASGGTYNYGGGIFCSGGTPMILRCTVDSNWVSGGNYAYGGGINSSNSDPQISRCVITNNYAVNSSRHYGGGIYCSGGTPTIMHCTVDSNWVSGGNYAYGGGINSSNSDPQISRCVITNNYAVNSSRHYGGGVYCNGLMPVMEHCTISGNWISTALYTYGAGICCYGGDMVLVNSIVEGNNGGSGVYFSSTIDTVSLSYSDFYGNSGGDFGGYPPAGLGLVTGVNGNGDPCDMFFNILLYPSFVNPGMGDYHLTEGSPCIDAGDPQMPFDPDGTIADMGAFYFDQSAPEIAVSADSLDFGQVTVGQDSSMGLVIYSVGNVPLVIYDVTASNPCFFTDFDPSDSLILPGDSLRIEVTFLPQDTVEYDEVLSIDNSDTLMNVVLQGEGLPSSAITTAPSLKVPTRYAISAVYPNPFNAQATIRYQVPETGLVRLTVYDILGREVAQLVDGVVPVGRHSVVWDAGAIPSGVYFVVFEGREFYQSEKMVVLK